MSEECAGCKYYDYGKCWYMEWGAGGVQEAPCFPEERTGHWIQQRNEDGWKMWLECSECGGTEQNLSAKFCPHCGARNH